MGEWLRTGAALAAACLLAGCSATLTGGGGGAGPAVEPTAVQATASEGPTTVVKGSTPAQLYSHVARQIRACWLNPRNPALPNHAFRAEAGAGGRSGNLTRIEIHQQTRDEKLGLRAFTVDFEPLRDGTRVTAQNLKIPEPQGQKYVADVGYWIKGGTQCHAPAPAAAGVPAIPAARVSQ